MGTSELLALSLALSMVVASLAYGLARLFELTPGDPALRERAWMIALYVPVLPILLIGAALVAPAPVWTGPGNPESISFSSGVGVPATTGVAVEPIGESLAVSVLVLAGLFVVVRSSRLVRRTLRLNHLVRATEPALLDVRRMVEEVARRQFVPAPEVRIQRGGSEILVTGLRRPVLVLPDQVLVAADPQALRAVCAHELAHLKRGDHRTVWIEEILLAALAFNPLLDLIRDHRAAAREEACDAVALAHVGDETRRLYARTLVEALRAAPGAGHAPALKFTTRKRTLAMRRLKAILSPAPAAAMRQHLVVLGLGVAISAVAGTSALALIAQRQPEISLEPASAVVIRSAPTAPVIDAGGTPAVRTRATAMPTKAEAVAMPEALPLPAPLTDVVTNPSWVRQPTPLSYPAAALEQGLTNGKAELSCAMQSDGRLSECAIVSEEPVGAGYGTAALEAAADARLSPRTVEGAAVGGTVRFTVRFSMTAE